jgi:hypothetical protein
MHYQLPPIVLAVPEKSLSPGDSTVEASETRRLQLLAYLTSKDDPIRPPALTKEADYNDQLAGTEDKPKARNEGVHDDDVGLGYMHAGGNEATTLKLRKVARKEVEQEVARKDDDHEGIEDGDGDDGHEYETNEGGRGHMDAGGKKNSRSHDKHPEADAVTRKVAR